ncbi:late histone H2B.L4-like [Amyelois transitella]|uniref:late histone H2B.L4-like n=1 Tax=Amyelois transitella TaxID=680683 RepID=UPI00067CC0D3|nr:late histone H2B.L4-like [Amyelois transitella]
MAPTKVPKKPLESIEKVELTKKIKKMKKKKKDYDSFNSYIYKVLRSVAPENIRISRKSMLIMNNAVNDLLERFAVEAGRLVAHGKKTTMGSREIQTAVRLLLPGELAKHANLEALKAVTLYHNSVDKPLAK